MRRKFLVPVAAFIAGALIAWWWLMPALNSPSGLPPGNFPPSAAGVSPEPPAAATAAAGALSSSGTVVPIPPALPPAEIARIVESNAQPGRMVFVDFEFAAGRITATRAVGAEGRAKPGPLQRGAGYLQFEVFSPSGERTLTGSTEDPLHSRFEYEDEAQPGTLRTKFVDRETGSLHLRIPGEANAARVVFFRETAVGREPAGEVILR